MLQTADDKIYNAKRAEVMSALEEKENPYDLFESELKHLIQHYNIKVNRYKGNDIIKRLADFCEADSAFHILKKCPNISAALDLYLLDKKHAQERQTLELIEELTTVDKQKDFFLSKI